MKPLEIDDPSEPSVEGFCRRRGRHPSNTSIGVLEDAEGLIPLVVSPADNPPLGVVRGMQRRPGKILTALTFIIIVVLSVAVLFKSIAPSTDLDIGMDATEALGALQAPSTDLDIGMDATEALGALQAGAVYRRLNGVVQNPFQMMRSYGYQWSRIRVMVDPNGDYGLLQDQHYVLETARQAKEQNLKILLDFHYSHWWADPENQWTPLTWREQINSTAYLSDKIYEHTKSVMQAMVDQGTAPDAVQVGNEVTNGMLWGSGHLPDHWGNFVQYVNQGIAAIDDVIANTAPKAKRPKIVMHLDTGGDLEKCEWWIRSYLSHFGKLDVLGLSYYPMWHGTLQDLKVNIDNISLKFPQLEIWVVETAYYFTGDGCAPNDDDCNRKLPFPQTEQGQYDYLCALRKTLLSTKCKAVFYWGSHWSQPKKWFKGEEEWEDAERRSLFDSNGLAQGTAYLLVRWGFEVLHGGFHQLMREWQKEVLLTSDDQGHALWG